VPAAKNACIFLTWRGKSYATDAGGGLTVSLIVRFGNGTRKRLLYFRAVPVFGHPTILSPPHLPIHIRHDVA
jgi:hypothetical protein